MQADRLPPQNLEAESAVLGSMLLDNLVVPDVCEVVTADDFYQPDAQAVFSAIVALVDGDKPADLLTVSDTLTRWNDLARVGGTAYLTSLVEGVPSAAHAEHYAGLVREASQRRGLVAAGAALMRLGHDGSTPIEEIVEQAEATVFAASNATQTKVTVDIVDVLTQVLAEAMSDDGPSGTALPTDYLELDDVIVGLWRGNLHLLAGRPSMGKTSLAMNIAARAACPALRRVPGGPAVGTLIFSLEMRSRDLIRNLLCSVACVDGHKVRKGIVDAQAMAALQDAAGVLNEAPLWVDDRPALTMPQLRSMARRMKLKHDVGLVVVDYLQLLEVKRDRNRNREQEVSGISRQLKALAGELDVPVLALCQLSRQTEHRDGGVPRLSDLRESGSLEQDADLVMLLYRADQYKPGDRAGECDVIVAKQRSGPTGKATLLFKRECLMFEDFVQQEAAAEPPDDPRLF